MKILEGQQVKAKFYGTQWHSEPKRCAKVVLAVRDMNPDVWSTLPPPFLKQYELMKTAGGPDKATFDLEVTGQNVKFYNSGVSVSHAYAAMGAKIDNFVMKKQQAEGSKDDDIVLYFSVLVDLDNASVPWMGQTFGNDILVLIEEAADPQQDLPLHGKGA